MFKSIQIYLYRAKKQQQLSQGASLLYIVSINSGIKLPLVVKNRLGKSITDGKSESIAGCSKELLAIAEI